MEASYILFQLAPYFETFNKRITKSSKLYFYDTAILCQLLDLTDAQQIDQFYMRGQLFENMAIVELLKNRWHTNSFSSFYFWQDSNKSEVDLVESAGLDTHLYEFKNSQTPSGKFAKGIKRFRQAAPEHRQRGRNIAFYAGQEPQRRSDLDILPWHQLCNY